MKRRTGFWISVAVVVKKRFLEIVACPLLANFATNVRRRKSRSRGFSQSDEAPGMRSCGMTRKRKENAAKFTVATNVKLRGLTLFCWPPRSSHRFSVGDGQGAEGPRGRGAKGPRPRLSVRLLPEFVEGAGVTNIAVVRPL